MLEPSQRDDSNDGSQNMFRWRNMDNYPVAPSYLDHWCISMFFFHFHKWMVGWLVVLGLTTL